MISLGDLEFKESDFGPVGFKIAKHSADIANRILREKLSKAPEVFGYKDSVDCEWSEVESFPSTGLHRARLVAIEEIEK